MEKTTALVILSGGQDSVTCLGVALKAHVKVQAISFRYGQRHAIELDCAADLCEKLKVPHKIVDLDFFGSFVTSALTGKGNVNDAHPSNPDLPASFVPNRNALFLTLAHAYAQEIGARVMYAGMCETDYSGYPDCRNRFIRNMEHTLNGGYLTNIAIATPLMELTKAQTFKLADDVGFLTKVIEDSHTCYNGDHLNFHPWGFGCGKCGACGLRKAGYEEFIASGDADE